LAALGLSLSVGSLGAPTSAAVLQSQLSRYQIQLSDWRHCPSGATPEGKRKIADLEAKATATQTQLKQVEAASSPQKVAAAATVSDSTDQRVRQAVGSVIDVLA
jgi:hypothetical protein